MMIVFFLYNIFWYQFQLHWSLMWWLNESHNGNKHVRNLSYHYLFTPCVYLLQFLKTLESSGWNLTKPSFGRWNPVHFSPFLNCLIIQWYLVSGYENQTIYSIDVVVIWISLSCYGAIVMLRDTDGPKEMQLDHFNEFVCIVILFSWYFNCIML